MNVNGREVRFMRTVMANCEIAQICKNHDLAKFDELLTSGDTIVSVNAQATFIVAMAKGWEMHEKFENPDYVMNVVTSDELMMLDPEDFSNLFTEAINAFAGDGAVTVEAEEVKTKKEETVDERLS